MWVLLLNFIKSSKGFKTKRLLVVYLKEAAFLFILLENSKFVNLELYWKPISKECLLLLKLRIKEARFFVDYSTINFPFISA